MALDLTPEQKATGRQNFEQSAGELARQGRMPSMAVGGTKGPDRRDFLKAGLAAGAVVPVSAAVYYGYESWKGNKAVRTALIGTGDEGGVLIGDHNPEFNDFVAVCDLRPSNLDRIFEGEPQGPRKGLNKIYGKDTAKKIARYDNVDALLADAKKLGLEAVVIATPLMTHDVIAKKCMDAGLHVLCEKLMARTIGKCKDMIKYAQTKGMLLSIGHQRHYSTLYAHAMDVINAGVLGDIKHIRAQWPRNNSWPFEKPDDPKKLAEFMKKNGYDDRFDLPYYQDGWCKPILKEDAVALEQHMERLKEYGFETIPELVRWRLYDKTGGGLMAELGSHQLDASSIILGHVHPLSVSGVGGKFFYGPGKNDRESDDGVFVNYEFPGKTYYRRDGEGHLIRKDGKPVVDNPSDIVVVSYSSFNTNSFESYGECVMGSRGTMIIEKEAEVYLYKEPDKTKKGDAAAGGRDTKVTVTTEGKKGEEKPAMAASSTWGGGGAAISKGPSGPAWDTPVRGYRTEMEHFAYCLRRWQDLKQPVNYDKDPSTGHLKHADIIPKCHGEVAMADAIIALTANMAMKNRTRIEFEEAWFDRDKADVPETKHGSDRRA